MEAIKNVPLNPINYSIHSQILEPIRQQQQTSKQEEKQQNKNHLSNESEITNENKNNIKNLKDKRQTSLDMFNDNSQSLDPFNDMELKTINDLEELKNILNTQQLQQQTTNNSNINLVSTLHNNMLSNDASMGSYSLDNFGLPKISFRDFDINRNNL
jgi:hypothetical protein